MALRRGANTSRRGALHREFGAVDGNMQRSAHTWEAHLIATAGTVRLHGEFRRLCPGHAQMVLAHLLDHGRGVILNCLCQGCCQLLEHLPPPGVAGSMYSQQSRREAITENKAEYGICESKHGAFIWITKARSTSICIAAQGTGT